MGFLNDLPDIINDAFNDEFFDCTLTRDGPTTGPAYDPTPGVPVTYSCKAIADNYSAGLRGQGLVGSTDVNILILAKSLPSGITPLPLDRVAIASQGVTGTIVPKDSAGMQAVQTDPARAAWSCRAST